MVSPLEMLCMGVATRGAKRGVAEPWLTLFGTLVLAMGGVARAPAREPTATRSFSVRDSIEMTHFGDLSGGDEADGEDGSYSPDGRYFAKLTHRGVLSTGELESTIWLFRATEIGSHLDDPLHTPPPSPKPLVRMAASFDGAYGPGGGEAIQRLKWSADGHSLAFLAHYKGMGRTLFTASIPDGELSRVSGDNQDVDQFDLVAGVFVYLAKPRLSEAEIWQSSGVPLPDVQVGTGSSLRNLLYPNYLRGLYGAAAAELWVVREGMARPVLQEGGGSRLRFFCGLGTVPILSLSPDGTQVAVLPVRAGVPKDWEAYGVGPGWRGAKSSSFVSTRVSRNPFDPLLIDAVDGQIKKPREYVVVSTKTGSVKSVLSAPYAGTYQGWNAPRPQAVWSPSGRQIAIANSYLPRQREPDPMAAPCMAAVVSWPDQRYSCLLHFQSGAAGLQTAPFKGFRWLDEGTLAIELGFQEKGPLPMRAAADMTLEFRSTGGMWAQQPGARQESAGEHLPDVVIEEGLNEAPILVAVAGLTSARAEIFNPNPQLAGVALGDAEPYRWRDSDGREFRGVLLTPPEYARGHGYPCVIQTHGADFSHFVTTGLSEQGYAARALAGRGMVVLQVEEPSDDYSTPREGSHDGMDVYFAAIDSLDREGMIDRRKVGILGFSRTGFYVTTALTRSPQTFAAAVLANTEGGSYLMYLLQVDDGPADQLDDINRVFADAAPPYGSGLAHWIEKSPGFNTDKVSTPTLFIAGDPTHLLGAWGFYGMLRAQSKPTELIYIRSGNHVLTKPRQRFVAQETTVDWFDFWLRNHEDTSDPHKGDQYRRWRELRSPAAVSAASALRPAN
jgi:hypothetical protein